MSQTDEKKPKPVERLFPFVLRAKLLILGQEAVFRSRKRVQFVLISTDLSPNSKTKILSDFPTIPVIQRFSSEELSAFFQANKAKVVGFKRSSLASAILSELKPWQVKKLKTEN